MTTTVPVQLRLGTRGSQLARWQAQWVADRLQSAGLAEIQLVPISTSGDRDQVGPIEALSSTGVFTKELQLALLREDIDLAVHSLKDLPTERIEGLTIAAVPARGPMGDVLVGRRDFSVASLPVSATIGTGSLRRRCQLWHARPDLRIVDVRGNVDTRLRKLAAGEYDGLVLAEAGLVRLGLDHHISQRLPFELMLPAVGQGALGIETRSGDQRTGQVLQTLNHPPTYAAVVAERTLLATLRGGCLAPVGAHAWVARDGVLKLHAVVCSPNGSVKLTAEGQGEDPQALGRRVAEDLLAQGAAQVIAQSRAV